MCETLVSRRSCPILVGAFLLLAFACTSEPSLKVRETESKAPAPSDSSKKGETPPASNANSEPRGVVAKVEAEDEDDPAAALREISSPPSSSSDTAYIFFYIAHPPGNGNEWSLSGPFSTEQNAIQNLPNGTAYLMKFTVALTDFPGSMPIFENEAFLKVTEDAYSNGRRSGSVLPPLELEFAAGWVSLT